MLKRIQILKQSNHQFQIYYDTGHYDQIGANLAFTVGERAPIVGAGYENTRKGKATTQFYNLDLSLAANTTDYSRGDQKRRRSSHGAARQQADGSQAPSTSHIGLFTISNSRRPSFSFLWFHFMDLKTDDGVTAISQSGQQEQIFYESTGSRHGKDYQTLVLNLLQGTAQYETGSQNYVLDSTSSGNPADTFEGSAESAQRAL